MEKLNSWVVMAASKQSCINQWNRKGASGANWLVRNESLLFIMQMYWHTPWLLSICQVSSNKMSKTTRNSDCEKSKTKWKFSTHLCYKQKPCYCQQDYRRHWSITVWSHTVQSENRYSCLWQNKLEGRTQNPSNISCMILLYELSQL